MSTHYVYSKCWPGGNKEIRLQQEFCGTRWECQKLIRARARAGSPTHFLFISSLDMDRASRRYL